MEKINSSLSELISNNEFPIIFIGSGISKRYLKNYPSWQELLEYSWERSGIKENMYAYLNKLKLDLEQKEVNNSDIDFQLNIDVATYLEGAINNEFNNENLEIDNFTHEESFKKNISPFKKLISNKFNNYEIREEMKDEVEVFSKMLRKSQVIFTTNYDTFIEDTYNKNSGTDIKKFIVQKGFFEQTPEYAEIYKVHGCVSDEKSVIITKEDYEQFDKNSVLISAKIISMLLNSPIIFMGYSLTDRNIRKILKDFSASLSKSEKKTLERKILVIQYDKNQERLIEEIESDNDIDCRITIIKTNNYKLVYDEVIKIDQGVAPTEIRKYQHIIKNLIVERGKTGDLDKFLVSPNALENMEETLTNKNIVLAIADKAVIFQVPTPIKYFIEYISENYNQNSDIILRFIAMQQKIARLPMLKYLTAENIMLADITKTEKLKLEARLKEFSDLDEQIKMIKSDKKTYNSLDSIIINNNKQDKIYKSISYNIKTLDLYDVKHYILNQLNSLSENGEITIPSELRRLALIYDLVKNNSNIDSN